MTLAELNNLDNQTARAEFQKCCGSSRWTVLVAERRPFQTKEQLFETADTVWNKLPAADWKEAFTHHPKIGDVKSLRKKFSLTATWAEGEQAVVQTAAEEVLQNLADGNTTYEKKFGFIFIVCATGKSAPEMLEMLQQRLKNDAQQEIRIAAEEQRKITRLRLEKLLS